MIVIIDYGMGNVGSICNMLKKVGAKAIISDDVATIEKAQKLILPGVGAFDHGMRSLGDRGMISLLNGKVLEDKTPILGLCLGMQLFTRQSEEGKLPGLGWLEAETIRFRFDSTNAHLKIPHMGWNTIDICQAHPIFTDLDGDSRFYFVHSYHLVCADSRSVLAWTKYRYEFASVVAKGKILGMQFHPEKSHRFGMKLLKNFVEFF